jgi:hypothetical protein
MAKGQRSNREIRKPKAAKAKRPLAMAAPLVPPALLAKPKGVGGKKGGR